LFTCLLLVSFIFPFAVVWNNEIISLDITSCPFIFSYRWHFSRMSPNTHNIFFIRNVKLQANLLLYMKIVYTFHGQERWSYTSTPPHVLMAQCFTN
jgi:hypothetical protein